MAERLEQHAVIAATQRWLERAVIGLNLCPFAKAVHARGQIRWVASDARDAPALAEELRRELLALHAADPQAIDTTLLIHAHVLGDFGDYNAFLDIADALVAALGLEGEIQVASFHPRYRFAATRPSDIGNATNRSPYPMLQLLREASVERALAACADAATIYERNIATLQRLGAAGWRALGVGPEEVLPGAEPRVCPDEPGQRR